MRILYISNFHQSIAFSTNALGLWQTKDANFASMNDLAPINVHKDRKFVGLKPNQHELL